MKTIYLLKPHAGVNLDAMKHRLKSTFTEGVLQLYTKWAYIVTDLTKLL